MSQFFIYSEDMACGMTGPFDTAEAAQTFIDTVMKPRNDAAVMTSGCSFIVSSQTAACEMLLRYCEHSGIILTSDEDQRTTSE